MSEQRPRTHTILFRTIAGSRLYGTFTDASDYDYRGVVLDPIETLIGLRPMFNQIQSSQERNDGRTSDSVLYGLRKFFLLALDANPNVLDILFAPPEMWTDNYPLWESVYNQRHHFLSGRVRQTFCGYAYSSLKNVQAGRSTSGIARKPIIEQHGWDTKDGSQLVRLIYSGIGLLKYGTYSPVLTGTALETVRGVREGRHRQSEVVEFAESMLEDMKSMQTDLPREPDFHRAESIASEILLANTDWSIL